MDCVLQKTVAKRNQATVYHFHKRHRYGVILLLAWDAFVFLWPCFNRKSREGSLPRFLPSLGHPCWGGSMWCSSHTMGETFLDWSASRGWNVDWKCCQGVRSSPALWAFVLCWVHPQIKFREHGTAWFCNQRGESGRCWAEYDGKMVLRCQHLGARRHTRHISTFSVTTSVYSA